MRTPFDRAVDEHGAAVLRVCRGVVGGHTDAEDAWSEAFLALLRAWPDLPDDTNVRAWLVTVAHRKAVDVVRARTRVPTAQVDENRPRPEALDPADRLALALAVADLPPRQRQAVALHHLGGLPYAEVANVTGSTEAAARRAASDGVRTLRFVLEDWHD